MIGTEYLNAGHHVVQAYGSDDELADGVAGYLLGALNQRDVAIVIATAVHRREFELRLERAGLDLAAARADGSYLAMDAAGTVHEFLAADRLEVMWDELARRDAFSRFCGYRADSATADAHLDAFAVVGRLHRDTVGGPSGPAAAAGDVLGAVRTFAFGRDAPAAARHFAVATLGHWGAGDLADDVALVVTELAANAVRHARSGFTVILSARRGVLRIAVRDASPLPSDGAGPALKAAPLHGLGAMDAMASRWGAEPLGSSGKTVWVELSR